MSSIQSIYKKLNDSTGIMYGWFSAMHSRVDIILYADADEGYFKTLITDIRDELIRIETLGNFFDANSELYKLNHTAHQHPVKVDSELFDIILDCMDYNGRTNGYFDISVKSESHSVNTLSEVEVSREQGTVFFREEGIKLDLSGYLKGYGLERIRSILNKNSISNALINLGNSSVLALGNHPHGNGWKISGKEKNQEFVLHNQCLTTSGNEDANRKHIINPLTGKYIEGKQQLTVITPSGTEGEVLSTALFVADSQQQNILKNKFNVKIYPN